MTTPWTPSLEADLDQLAAKMLSDAPQRIPALREEFRVALNACNTGLIDTLSITLIYLAGFANVADAGDLASQVSPEVVNWVKKVSPKQSATRMAGIVSTNVCSALEGFIMDIGEIKIDTAVIARLTTPRQLPADATDAKNALIRAIKPSVKADGAKWIKALKDVFLVTIPPAVEGSLLPMIRFRNLYVHDTDEAFKTTVTGEELKCWSLAGVLLANLLASS